MDETKIALAIQSLVICDGDAELQSGTLSSLSTNRFSRSVGELYVKIDSNPTGGNIQAASQYSALRVNHNYRLYNYIDLRYSNNVTPGVAYSSNTTGFEISNSSISGGIRYGIRGYKNIDPIILPML